MERPKRVLIVDDNPSNIALVNDLLRPHYRTTVANAGQRALELLAQGIEVDLILLDVMMPEMDGYAVCARLKATPAWADIPVVFVTAQARPEEQAHALSLGVVDFITKPVSPQLLLARVRNHLQLAEAGRLLRQQNQLLERRVAERTQELSQRNSELWASRQATLTALCSLAEARDNDAGNHIRRTQEYVRLLAVELAANRRYRHDLDDEQVDLFAAAAALHDIGKVAIPDHILLKPARLSPEEFLIMQGHTTLGEQALARAEALLPARDRFLLCARQIAVAHHERWDGQGYPQRLAGEAIPLPARLMALADVYDALISRRPYKDPWHHDDARDWILSQAGKAFDPDVTACFARVAERMTAVARSFEDA